MSGLLRFLRSYDLAQRQISRYSFRFKVVVIRAIYLKAKMASGALKMTTKLTLLPVAKNPHHTLGALYSKTLRVLQKMPENAAYRKYTEQIVQDRYNAVQKEQNVAKLEEKINCGQIEEVIIQAENELNLARKMLTWKPWEPLCQETPKDQWKWPIGK
ncbi:hypothetical protein J437_LFUL004491 [Ladona fulva]|uniref:NADH dehydrogenase [ubiquinone] 1 alpha subcomplex subunit 5 n=1 Tax=Ladona fulva TaxID=123851 RepID=A0A8K0KDV9_LADFU|nr:hypothetical protein J437_LFUL004491 [Ladona fulva]